MVQPRPMDRGTLLPESCLLPSPLVTPEGPVESGKKVDLNYYYIRIKK